MQHIEADQSLAVERYLLGDMTASELEQFEEHIFMCAECAESVKTGAAFVDNSRAVFREPASQIATEARTRAMKWEPTPWWKNFMRLSFVPALVALALLCVVGYQQVVVVPRLRMQLAEVTAPQGLPTFPLHAVARGPEQPIAVPSNAHFFDLYFDVAEASASGYSCAIMDSAGSVRFTGHVAPLRPEAGGTLHLLIGSSRLAAGEYTLVVSVESPGKAEIGRYPFTIQYR